MRMISHGRDVMGEHAWYHAINETQTVNTTNHNNFLGGGANGSCVAIEPLFTPLCRELTTPMPIFIEKGSRGSLR